MDAAKGSKKNIVKAVTTCPLAHKFNVGSAEKEPKKGKKHNKAFCTNVPVKCVVCVCCAHERVEVQPAAPFCNAARWIAAPDEMQKYMTVSALEKEKLLSITLP